MTARTAPNPLFKRALVWSATAHTVLFVVLMLNPSLPKRTPKGRFEYIPVSLMGAGGGPPAGATLGTTAVPRPNLRDLTTLQKVEPKPESKLRAPADKPKKAPAKKTPDKKAAISKPDPEAKAAPEKTAAEPAGRGAAAGAGSGLTMGAGGPGFGEGAGADLAGQIGVFDFPYAWYLQNIQDRISSNWFTSLVDPGVRGMFQVAVYFRIYRNGSISEVEVRRSSEIPSLDLSAKRAVQNAQPFPPLPPDYDKNYLGIILIFEHSK